MSPQIRQAVLTMPQSKTLEAASSWADAIARRWVRARAAVGLLTLVACAGCHSMPKFPGTSGLSPKAPAAEAVSKSTPGTSDFSTSDKLRDPVKVHLAYALWHEQEGNLVEARNSYDRVLDENPRNVEALLGLSRLDIAAGRLEDAEMRLTKAQKLAPKNAQVAISRGQYYSAREEWPQALEAMQLARSLSKYDPACAYHLGYVQAKMGDTASALSNFTEAVGAAEAQYNLAYILYEQGNLVGAEDHLQRAISQKPDLSQAQSLLLTVRQQRHGTKLPIQQARVPAASTGVQPASYEVPASPAPATRYEPAPARH